MGTEQKSTLKLILGLVTAIIIALSAIFAASNYYQFNIGNTVINNIFQGSDNSQTNPPTTATAPPPTTSNPTQQSTAPTPSPSNSDNSNSVSFSTPTPQPTPTPISAIDLPFGVTATNTITPSTTSHLYKVVLPQAGRLTVSMARSGNIGLQNSKSYDLLDSEGNRVARLNLFLTIMSPISSSCDLEAGTYYIEITKIGSNYGGYDLWADFVPF